MKAKIYRQQKARVCYNVTTAGCSQDSDQTEQCALMTVHSTSTYMSWGQLLISSVFPFSVFFYAFKKYCFLQAEKHDMDIISAFSHNPGWNGENITASGSSQSLQQVLAQRWGKEENLVPGVSLSLADTFQLRWMVVVRWKWLHGLIQVIASSWPSSTATGTALFTETN